MIGRNYFCEILFSEKMFTAINYQEKMFLKNNYSTLDHSLLSWVFVSNYGIILFQRLFIYFQFI